MTDKQLSMFPEADNKSRSESRGGSFTLTRSLPGSPQKVFDRWLIPVFLEQWLVGPHVGDDEILELSNTVRRGGEFEFITRRQGQETRYSGSYRELRMPRLLTFNWRKKGEDTEEFLVNVEFAEQGDKTRLKLTVSLPSELAGRKDIIRNQWKARCDALAARLKSH